MISKNKKTATRVIRKYFNLACNNLLLTLFILIIILVDFIATYKLLFPRQSYIYVKVKVGQGYWWAPTSAPGSWYLNALRNGEEERDLLGRSIATIVRIEHYPSWQTNQDGIYLVLKLKASYNKRTGEYNFDRSIISVGSPIDIQFPKIDVTGTVIDINLHMFKPKYVWKTVYLVNTQGYTQDFKYRYDDIHIGDSYNDGNQKVFEIMAKYLVKNIWTISNNLNAQVYDREVDSVQNIVVKAKILVQAKPDGYYFGEESKIINNSYVPLEAAGYRYENFSIRQL